MKDVTKIIKVRKNAEGDITDVMIEDGNIYEIRDAIMLAKEHKIEGVNVGRTKNGNEFLRSNRNNKRNDNLDSFPTF
ncbi:DUF3892 domain-containing protein [Crassaminicella profunda]|uniref:DUF3892 domain-containing protein n=1 Tax=Crassaminicella profunda TaxID=1286698 RepID=UPI001CA6379A|nr:DUF3892 domain-containing protein [Crassaminicella profunda]QZY56353.1 DUF3892 domain-containing protein [Crassaminicella profunda]